MSQGFEREVCGKLFKYNSGGAHVAFASGKIPSRKVAIQIGGLTDGLLALPYTTSLAKKLESAGWTLIQMLLSSSHLGYGISSLQKDSEEIDMLLTYLSREWGWDSQQTAADAGPVNVVIVGHSTGCQDAVWHCTHGKERGRVTGVVLQGPVSDREHAETLPNTKDLLRIAKELESSAGKESLMPREADYCGLGTPLTAYRYQSLAGRMGDDDMFSSDFSDQELSSRLGPVKVPALVVISMEDEYMPPHVDKKALGGRLAAAMPHGEAAFVNADHSISGQEAQQVFLDQVVKFLSKLEAPPAGAGAAAP